MLADGRPVGALSGTCSTDLSAADTWTLWLGAGMLEIAGEEEALTIALELMVRATATTALHTAMQTIRRKILGSDRFKGMGLAGNGEGEMRPLVFIYIDIAH